jgi:hypothetical protein
MEKATQKTLFCNVPKCFVPLSFSDLAAFLGIAPSVLSRDCKVVGINMATHISHFDLPSTYRMWCLRVLLVSVPGTKRSHAPLIAGDLRELAKYMGKLECGTMKRFATAYSYWVSTGQCIRTGGYTRGQPLGLQRHNQRVKRRHGHYALRSVIARYFGVCPATITGYMRGLGYHRGTPINLHIFKRLWRLKRAIDYWQDQLDLYGSRLTYYQRYEYPFSARCTVKKVVVLESSMIAAREGLSTEYAVIQSLPVDISKLESDFRDLVAEKAITYN